MLEAWLMVSVLAMTGGGALCDIQAPRVRTHEANLALLVVATGQKASAKVPRDPESLAVTVSEVPAWRFRVVDAVGAEDDMERGETLLFVPWAYDSGCDMLVWSESWVPPGDTAVFILSRDQLAQAGEPVVHTLGWHSPYPHAAFFGAGQDREDRADWLSAREYFSLLSALPVHGPEVPREHRLEGILRVFGEGPAAWSEKYPGSEILRSIVSSPPSDQRGIGTDVRRWSVSPARLVDR